MTLGANDPVIITVSDFPSSGSRLTSADIVQLARVADDVGIDRLTISDYPFHRDLIPLMTACLVATHSLVLESLVTSPHYRLPETTATTFATMAELSEYRVVLGLGRGGVPLNIPPWGKSRPNALLAMEEMVAVCRSMWNGGTAGPTKVIPTSQMPMNFSIEKMIPILIAAGGMRMLELAARIADIVHIAPPFVGRSYLMGLVDHIADAGKQAGRSDGSFEIDVTVPVSVLPDGAKAKRLAKVTAGMGVSWMSSRMPEGEQFPDEFLPAVHLIEPITTGWKALGDVPFPDELAELIDDDLLSLFSIAGEPDECLESLVELVRALPRATGIRIKLPSLTSDDAPQTYAAMISELGAIAPKVRSARFALQS